MLFIQNDITKTIGFEMILKDFSEKESIGYSKRQVLEGLFTGISVIMLTCNKTLKLSYGLSIFRISLTVEP